MKVLILILGLVCFSAASAQQKDVFDLPQQQEKKSGLEYKQNENIRFNQELVSAPNQASTIVQPLSFSLTNGNKVIYGIGIMPCIKPDMNLFKTMPNLNFTGTIQFSSEIKEPGQIPNGAK
jgi:hypothetical protein